MKPTQAGFAANGGTDIYFESFGDAGRRPLILINGLGSQLLSWSDGWCRLLLDRGYRVLRFDNRDTGLSSKTPGPPPSMADAMTAEPFDAAYSLADMAADTVAILDAAGIASAHVVGTSLGGAIAQTLAIDFPSRVRSLTSIMSGPGARAMIGDADPNDSTVVRSLTEHSPDPATWLEARVEGWRANGGQAEDEDWYRVLLQRGFDRCYHPAGWSWQMLALRAGGEREARLAGLKIPCLVIHGAEDPLVPLAAGQATAAAIPGARLWVIDGMGHVMSRALWPRLVDAIAAVAVD